jgi:hypothetical protein
VTNEYPTRPKNDSSTTRRLFTRQANHFSECVLANRTPSSPGEKGLRDMKYIVQILWGGRRERITNYPFIARLEGTAASLPATMPHFSWRKSRWTVERV